MRTWKLGLAAALFATAGAASAQTQAPRDPNMPDPKNVPAEKIAPAEPNATGTTSGETLTERLERTDGVIKPPTNVDPGIVTKAPVPDPGTTPVIKPKGDFAVQPPR